MVQFILGRSGTGKTSLCIKQITDCLLTEPRPSAFAEASSDRQGSGLNRGEQNLVLLVPEQATYQAERAILSDNKIKGYSRLHVLSFQRLCYLIFGKNLAARPLTEQAKDMIVHRLLCENAAKLEVFSSAAANTGTAVRIAAVLTELQQQSKLPDDIDKLIRHLKDSSELTASKFSDINLIFKQYLAFVEGNFLNNDNQLNLARDAAASTPFFKNCLLWVDGFAGFTTSEMLLLAELLKVSASSKIALCLDPAAAGDWAGIFETTQKTYTDLISILKTLKLPVEKPVILKEPNRFKGSKALMHLEKNIFSFDPVPPVSAQGNIKITACAKARLEVDFTARQICSLVRDKGFRWRDIAVIASDIDQYRHYIQAIFSDFDIPFFIDRRRDLRQYPAVELITGALKIATDRFTTNDVINYLKSDLVPISRNEVDRLENYCLAFGVEPNDWLDNAVWNFAPPEDNPVFDNKEIDNLRRKATEHLLAFRTLLQSAGTITIGQFRDGLFTFLDNLDAREQLSDWTKAALTTEKLDEAQLHQQFFAKFTQMMDDFVFIFKDSVLSVRQYALIIGSAFSSMTVALIPPAIDQVLVGSIERSRHPDLKAVFLIGATQQQFPIPVYYDNILNDSDRRIASDAGFELSRTGPMQLIERRYLAYIAFTRPSCFLYITYPLVDDNGSQVQSSFLVSQLKTLFTDLAAGEEKYFGGSDILNSSDLTVLLASRLGKDNLSPADDVDSKYKWLLDTLDSGSLSGVRYGPLWDALRQMPYGRCLTADGLRSLCEKVKSAINYQNTARLDNLPAQNVLSLSATKLRSFASCPYKYFAKHLLELKERRIFELEPFSLGLFFHKVLELLFNSLKSRNLTFSAAQPDLLDQLTDNAVKKLLIEDSFLKSFNARTKHNSFIVLSAVRMVKEAVLEFSQIASAGSFTQIASETGFGDRFSLPAVEIKLENGKKLSIEGRIDRIDAVCSADRNYCLIVDYKQSETKINWSLFSAGLDLQLPMYLLAVRNQTVEKYRNLVPLGGFYFHIQVFSQPADLSEIGKKTQKIIRKPKGIFNGEFFKLIDNKTEKGDSPYFGFYITKDGLPYGCYAERAVLHPGHFSAVLSFAENKIREFGEKILSGLIDVNPYRYGRQTACANCAYKSLCRFDRQINDYAQVKNISKSEFFESIK